MFIFHNPKIPESEHHITLFATGKRQVDNFESCILIATWLYFCSWFIHYGNPEKYSNTTIESDELKYSFSDESRKMNDNFKVNKNTSFIIYTFIAQ